MRQTVYENLQGMLADAIALKRPVAEIQSIRSQLARYDDIKKWVVRQGRSRATVRAADYFAARDRAAQIGFRNPDAIMLDDGAGAERSAELQAERLAEWRADDREAAAMERGE